MRAGYRLILNFHGLGEPPDRVEPDEHPYWLDPALFEQILDFAVDRPDIRLTFDDGNASDFEIAWPALRARGLPASFFVLAGRLDQPGYLTGEQLRELRAQGMTIGTHGMHHRPWGRCAGATLVEELDDARGVIEQAAGGPIDTAACPFGSYGRTALRRLRQLGFRRVFTSDGGLARAGSWLQRRNTLRRDHRLEDVRRWEQTSPHSPPALLRRMKSLVKRYR